MMLDDNVWFAIFGYTFFTISMVFLLWKRLQLLSEVVIQCILNEDMRLLPHLRLVIGFHPSILRETINYPSASFQSKETVTRNIDAAINELIMPKEIKFLLQDLARNVCNIRFQSDESCSPILFHGPDGKRMAAMMLAKAIGMNFAHVNGQDVITTGQEGTTQLQTLFAWTKLCSDGVLLFIDNADAFLPHSMNNLSTGDKKQNALSTFICNMNNLQQNIILVLGIKCEQDLNREIMDKCEERILFPLPNCGCRKEMILCDFDRHVRLVIECTNRKACTLMSKAIQFLWRKRPPVLITIDEDVMAGDQLEEIVAATDGFSGDDIELLMLSMQQEAKASVTGKFDFSSAWRIVIEEKAKHDKQGRYREHNLSYLECDVPQQELTLV